MFYSILFYSFLPMICRQGHSHSVPRFFCILSKQEVRHGGQRRRHGTQQGRCMCCVVSICVCLYVTRLRPPLFSIDLKSSSLIRRYNKLINFIDQGFAELQWKTVSSLKHNSPLSLQLIHHLSYHLSYHLSSHIYRSLVSISPRPRAKVIFTDESSFFLSSMWKLLTTGEFCTVLSVSL